MRKRELLHIQSELIECECGCGEMIHSITWLGKPARFKTHHNMNVPKSAANWKGGKIINTQGYVLIHNPKHPYCNSDGYVREHRLVMEKKLGRYLIPKIEDVHHKNGDKKDNRIRNLKIMNESEHGRLHAIKNGLGGDTTMYRNK